MIGWQERACQCRPFDRNCAALKMILKAKVHNLDTVADAIQIQVKEGYAGSALDRKIFVHQCKARADNGSSHAQAIGDALDKRRLTGAENSTQRDDVARLKETA